MQNEIRQPHAVLDLPSRSWKAEKIARLLKLASRKQPIRLLEIGTGSGGIAHWFAHHPQLRCEVVAVDVCDNRQALRQTRTAARYLPPQASSNASSSRSASSIATEV